MKTKEELKKEMDEAHEKWLEAGIKYGEAWNKWEKVK